MSLYGECILSFGEGGIGPELCNKYLYLSSWELNQLVIQYDHCDCGVSQKLSPVRMHGPMPQLTLHVFLDPRSNKLSTVKANWTNNYPEVDNWLFPNCVATS